MNLKKLLKLLARPLVRRIDARIEAVVMNRLAQWLQSGELLKVLEKEFKFQGIILDALIRKFDSLPRETSMEQAGREKAIAAIPANRKDVNSISAA